MPAMSNPNRASGGGRGGGVARMGTAPRASSPAKAYPRVAGPKPKAKPKMSAAQRKITTAQALREDNAKYAARLAKRNAKGSTVLSKMKVETSGERNKREIATVDRVTRRDPDAPKRKTRDERVRVPPGGDALKPRNRVQGRPVSELNRYWNKRLTARQQVQAEDRRRGQIRSRAALEREREDFRQDVRRRADQLANSSMAVKSADRLGIKLPKSVRKEPTAAQKALARKMAIEARNAAISARNEAARKAAYSKPPGYRTPTESPPIGEKGNTVKGQLKRSGEDVLPKPPKRTMREAEKKGKYSDPTGDAAVARVMKNWEKRETARLRSERKSGSRTKWRRGK